MTEAGLAAPAETPGAAARADHDGVRRFGTSWLALALVVGLLVGLGAGLLAPVLTRPGDDSPEAGFARDMSTHHAQAVEMGTLAYAKATDPEVRNLAIDIALTQKAQIGMMQTWLTDWHLDPTGAQPRMAWMPGGAEMVMNGRMPGMATEDQLKQLRAATGKDFDVMFLRLMRAHHVGGIHMAEAVVKLSDDSQVRDLAQSMISGQRSEIEAIDQMLGRLGAK